MTNVQEAPVRRATLATLVWTLPVRILDVSPSGCRLEASRWLEVGTSGRLRMALCGRTHQDDVRIARCQLREGSGQNYFLGAELLQIRRLDARSIRRAIGEWIGEYAASEHPPANNLGFRVPDRGSEQLEKGVSRAPPRLDDP